MEKKVRTPNEVQDLGRQAWGASPAAAASMLAAGSAKEGAARTPVAARRYKNCILVVGNWLVGWLS